MSSAISEKLESLQVKYQFEICGTIGEFQQPGQLFASGDSLFVTDWADNQTHLWKIDLKEESLEKFTVIDKQIKSLIFELDQQVFYFTSFFPDAHVYEFSLQGEGKVSEFFQIDSGYINPTIRRFHDLVIIVDSYSHQVTFFNKDGQRIRALNLEAICSFPLDIWVLKDGSFLMNALNRSVFLSEKKTEQLKPFIKNSFLDQKSQEYVVYDYGKNTLLPLKEFEPFASDESFRNLALSQGGCLFLNSGSKVLKMNSEFEMIYQYDLFQQKFAPELSIKELHDSVFYEGYLYLLERAGSKTLIKVKV